MSTNHDILRLNAGTSFGAQNMSESTIQKDFTVVDIYELPELDLNPYICMVINGLIDQEFLTKHKDKIHDFLNERKIVVFSGNLFRPWLPGGSNFVPKEVRSHLDYTVSLHQPHPIFDGVTSYDMTFNKGVSGFFARGHHPLPEGAEVLLTLPGGEPITYIDRHSTKGTLLVHSGNDLFGNGSTEKTSGRIAPQLLKWVREEYAQLQQRERGVEV
jgi:hypothetical protein